MKFNFLSAISALCFVVFATPSFAQNAQPKAQSSQSVQTTVSNDGATPPNVTTEKFDDWIYRCTDTQENKQFTKNCEILQIQQAKQEDQVTNVLILAIAQVKGEKPGDKPALMMTSVVPLNVFLLEGILFTIEKQNVMQIPFRYCNQQGCWSQVMLDNKTLDTFKKGNEGKARFMIMNGQAIDVKFSLKGLTKALEKLQATKP